MDQPPPHLNETSSGRRGAHASADLDGRVCPISLSLSPRAIRFMALVWVLALMLGQASIAVGLGAWPEESRPERYDVAATVEHGHLGSPIHGARLRSGSFHALLKRFHAVPRITLSNEVNDDDASGDSDDDDDDDTSKFLNSDDPGASIMACFDEIGPCLLLLECTPVTWIAPVSSSHLKTQRLRC